MPPKVIQGDGGVGIKGEHGEFLWLPVGYALLLRHMSV